ncbi:juvenile hormone acid O-methyltransferase [Trichonephila inaurata madagascariensis]|uniref:Juvenile hormone acid O-methyltransferase n=1 Tax=Trichonephila inaurata madagascariensis TaxID=2747483 RepID=A0A8X6Y2V8_9ARAC|nr:juvenile hormone acid O-methyltransferase [Trichonephila inaurata madagascariensis]
MNLDSKLYGVNPIPFPSVKKFFRETLPWLGAIKDGEDDVVLDIGCGPGGTTVQLILPLLPKLKILYAIDAVQNMIDLARKRNFHPKIQYSVANIEDWSTVKHWRGQISKLVSVYCFQWLKNQKKGFQNVYHLLKPGGQAVILIVSESPYASAVSEMQNNLKWKRFLKDIDTYTTSYNNSKFNTSYYNKILREIGFEILHCKREMKNDVFISEEQYRDFFTSINVSTSHIPVDRKEEFLNEFFETLDRHSGRNKNELPVHRGRIMELIIRKPDYNVST